MLIKAGLRAGWDDPEMDIYNDLDPPNEQTHQPLRVTHQPTNRFA